MRMSRRQVGIKCISDLAGYSVSLQKRHLPLVYDDADMTGVDVGGSGDGVVAFGSNNDVLKFVVDESGAEVGGLGGDNNMLGDNVGKSGDGVGWVGAKVGGIGTDNGGVGVDLALSLDDVGESGAEVVYALYGVTSSAPISLRNDADEAEAMSVGLSDHTP